MKLELYQNSNEIMYNMYNKFGVLVDYGPLQKINLNIKYKKLIIRLTQSIDENILTLANINAKIVKLDGEAFICNTRGRVFQVSDKIESLPILHDKKIILNNNHDASAFHYVYGINLYRNFQLNKSFIKKLKYVKLTNKDEYGYVFDMLDRECKIKYLTIKFKDYHSNTKRVKRVLSNIYLKELKLIGSASLLNMLIDCKEIQATKIIVKIVKDSVINFIKEFDNEKYYYNFIGAEGNTIIYSKRP